LCPLPLVASDLSGTHEALVENAAPTAKEAPDQQIEGRPLRTRAEALPERISRQQKDRTRGENLPTLAGFEREVVQSAVKRWSAKPQLRWIESCLKNGEPYLAFVRAEVEKRALPPDLVFLPLIESGFLPTAKSASGASGLWQFMRNSIYPYMKIDEWRDDRRDFWKSTNAALSKLEAHYKEFDDWALALAAYNSGAGAVGRTIKTAGIRDYWLLSEKKKLKNESVLYVPKLIAISYIISNPRKYQLDICKPEKEYSWVQVAVDRQINLPLLARYAEIESADLHRANSELLTLLTPPGEYHLKILRSDEERVKAVLENQDIKLLNHYVHTVRTGDTLYALADHYGVSLQSILSDNAGLQADKIMPGDKLMIPAIREVAPYQTSNTEKSFAHWSGTWTVKNGDTLWSIARFYSITSEELRQANNMPLDAVLSIGKVLRVP
jgi:membrane-bound lytic murein transglycosylase D